MLKKIELNWTELNWTDLNWTELKTNNWQGMVTFGGSGIETRAQWDPTCKKVHSKKERDRVLKKPCLYQ